MNGNSGQRSILKQLIQSFGEIAKISREGEEAFLSIALQKDVPKNEVLLREGNLCNQIYFIEKGTARTFYYRDGKDITYWIATEGEFVGSMASFFSRTPSNKYVETLENSVLWVFDYYKLENLYSKSKELERMGRLFASYGIAVLEKKFDDYHFLTAKERYTRLLERRADILQKVPLGIVASYLGITQETLSRIRGKI
jgi:CRP-like cAMP-binding protein